MILFLIEFPPLTFDIFFLILDLLPSEIPILNQAPDALNFLRNFVTPNIPFIIRNGVKHWPALFKWNKDYLR